MSNEIPEIVNAARAVIANEVGFPVGCLRLHRLLTPKQLKEDFAVFAEYYSATLSLPIGPERITWERNALRGKDVLLNEANQKYGDRIIDLCFKTISDFESPHSAREHTPL